MKKKNSVLTINCLIKNVYQIITIKNDCIVKDYALLSTMNTLILMYFVKDIKYLFFALI